jgi:hypothetical protein
LVTPHHDVGLALVEPENTAMMFSSQAFSRGTGI